VDGRAVAFLAGRYEFCLVTYSKIYATVGRASIVSFARANSGIITVSMGFALTAFCWIWAIAEMTCAAACVIELGAVFDMVPAISTHARIINGSPGSVGGTLVTV